MVLVVMLAFGSITRAYADDYEGGGGASQSFNSSFGTVWYGPTASGLYVRYGVVANTRYDAAVYCCRGRSFDLNDLSATKKSKLLNNGDFNQFAQLFNASKPELTDDWSGDAAIVQSWNSARQLYGETYCWNARYTNDQKIRAQEAIEDVLNDDDTPSGGGSGSGGVTGTPEIGEDVALIPVTEWYENELNVEYVMITQSAYSDLQSFISSHDNYILLAYVGANGGKLGKLGGRVCAISEDGFKFYQEAGDGSSGRTWCIRCFDLRRVYYIETGGTVVEHDGKRCFDMRGAAVSQTSANALDGCYPIMYRNYDEDAGGGGDDEPTEPPIEWPTPPTETPTPPEVPTPGDPTQPTPPDPVTPTPGNPWIPIPDEDISITGEDFQDLIDALNEHCIHLQDSIQSNVSQLWDLQSDFLGTQFEDLFGLISDNFTWLGSDVIAESYNDLKSYLHELFEWLSEQLNFDVTVEGGQYDDTSVLYWLKQIWAKLPTGINTRPTDPVTNPDGWWDWLTQLLNNLAADLMALGHDELAGVLETLNELRNKFPFSLPWDVAALLGLLVGVPVCPEFDMPCYTVTLEGLQEVGTYHITLEPYETVWEGVKWIETLAFAVYLIMNTGGLMDMVTKTVRPR